MGSLIKNTVIFHFSKRTVYIQIRMGTSSFDAKGIQGMLWIIPNRLFGLESSAGATKVQPKGMTVLDDSVKVGFILNPCCAPLIFKT